MAPLACVANVIEPGYYSLGNSTNILVLGTQQPTCLLPEMHFEFPFKLVGKSTMTFLMGQS